MIKLASFRKKIAKEDAHYSGRKGIVQYNKPMTDKLIFLLHSNASGDFKVKSLLVYHSEILRFLSQTI